MTDKHIFVEVLLGMAFWRPCSDNAVFVRDKLFVLVHVDDLIVTASQSRA